MQLCAYAEGSRQSLYPLGCQEHRAPLEEDLFVISTILITVLLEP
jgi:hypothetical protein